MKSLDFIVSFLVKYPLHGWRMKCFRNHNTHNCGQWIIMFANHVALAYGLLHINLEVLYANTKSTPLTKMPIR